MTLKKMTVHEGLATIKLYEAKIKKEIRDLNVVSYKGKDKKIMDNGMTEKDWKEKGKAKYQSVIDLINNRNAVKRAITKSNATTTIEVGGKTYTVAEAIDMKSAIEFTEDLYAELSSQRTMAISRIAKENARLHDEAIERSDAYLGSEKADKTKLDEFIRDYEAPREYILMEAINSDKEIDTLYNEIANFNSEVDFRLSTSNALTVIEVELA